jgi:hypothetical protein
MLQQAQRLHFCLHTDVFMMKMDRDLAFFGELLVRIRINPNLVPDLSINEQKDLDKARFLLFSYRIRTSQ